jgi:hypothetical protein
VNIETWKVGDKFWWGDPTDHWQIVEGPDGLGQFCIQSQDGMRDLGVCLPDPNWRKMDPVTPVPGMIIVWDETPMRIVYGPDPYGKCVVEDFAKRLYLGHPIHNNWKIPSQKMMDLLRAKSPRPAPADDADMDDKL